MAMQRLGKQVVEFTNVTEKFGDKTVLDHIDWHVGPGDRYGILGENGAGKTPLLSVLDGSLRPSSGFVKIGKTVKFAVLSQRLDELNELGKYRVTEVLLAPQEATLWSTERKPRPPSCSNVSAFRRSTCTRVSMICRAVKSAVCSCCSFFWKSLMGSFSTRQATRHRYTCRIGGFARYMGGHARHGDARSLFDGARDRRPVRADRRPLAPLHARRGRIPRAPR